MITHPMPTPAALSLYGVRPTISFCPRQGGISVTVFKNLRLSAVFHFPEYACGLYKICPERRRH